MTAFIDIGTNSVRMLIAEVKRGKNPEVISRHGVVTKLGEGLGHSRKLSPKAIDRPIQEVEGFREISGKHGHTKVMAFATSALRKAANRREFTRILKEKTGIDVEILSEQKEASLLFSGVKTDFPFREIIVVDIGGGSTEISYRNASSDLILTSVDIGALTLAETFSLNFDIPCRKIDDALDHALDALKDRFPRPEGEALLVGTGGTITSLAGTHQGLAKYEPAKVHKSLLNKDEVEDMFRRLSKSSKENIRKIPSLESGREDSILGGVIILLSVLLNSGFESITISTKSILWGKMIEYQRKLGS